LENTDNQNQGTDNSDQQVSTDLPTTQVQDWRAGLDVSVKEHPSLKNFKSPGDLAKSWVEAQKLIGRDKIPVPGEKATKEDWDMVFERLGRPKDKDGYTLPELQTPEGFPAANKEFMDTFKQKAHELGMLPQQVNELYKWYMDQSVNEFNQHNQSRIQERGKAETTLRKAWGKAFEQNFTIAEQAVNKYGTPKFINKLKQSGMNNDPDMIQFIADMAKNFSEDKIAGRPQGLTLSPEEAIARIAQMKAEGLGNPKHPMNDKRHPEQEIWKAKWKEAHEMAYPNG
jgi:hypothetical protein